MKKILLIPLLTTFVLSNEINLLSKDKLELREIEKKIIKENHQNSKNEWISSIDLSSNLSRSHSFSDESDKFSKSVSLGFSQSIYKSGGIDLTIQYANEQLKSDTIAWDNENKALLQTIYEILLNISKINTQLKQSSYSLKNKDIELILKKIQYEAGDVDIISLNDAIIAKNSQYKSNINLKNSLKEQELDLSKYTDLKYQEIELLDFRKTNKKDYLQKNIELLYEKSLINLQDTSYKKLKTTYLPSVSFSTNLSYSNSDNLTANTNSDSTSGSLGLKLSIPLYDINKKSSLEKSKLELLKKRVNLNDLKSELSKSYDESLTKIDTYEKYNQTIKENIALYNDLIEINEISNQAMMSSTYDLEILKNSNLINQYDLEINNINIQLEYAKLYFKIKATK